MKITGFNVYQVDLPLHEGSYSWSEGKSVDVFDSTVVQVDTDAGLTGFGEVCPLGPVYLPAYAAGVRTEKQKGDCPPGMTFCWVGPPKGIRPTVKAGLDMCRVMHALRAT